MVRTCIYRKQHLGSIPRCTSRSLWCLTVFLLVWIRFVNEELVRSARGVQTFFFPMLFTSIAFATGMTCKSCAVLCQCVMVISMTSEPLQQTLHRWVVHSELAIQVVERTYPEGMSASQEWTMWLAQDDFPSVTQTKDVKLHAVHTPEDWRRLLALRVDVEKAFGLEDAELVALFVEDVRRKSQQFEGQWYLAQVEGEDVGEIGLLIFEWEGRRVGRLQDVDILPRFQGRGYGRQLLQQICALASKRDCEGLCLMAKAEDWPRHWYRRFGFVQVGDYTSQPQHLGLLRAEIWKTLVGSAQCHTAILYGSWACGRATAVCDVRVVGLADSGTFEHRRTPWKYGVIDVQVYPQSQWSHAVKLPGISDGLVLKERDGFGTQLLRSL